MRCLLVEDEKPRIDAVLPELKKLFGHDAVVVAEDRDAAMERVTEQAFDLVVLDQRIPSRQGQLDPDVIHGRAVLERVRQVAPDTIVYFLTALPLDDDYTDQLFATGQSCDVFGDRKPTALVQRFQKASLAKFYGVVEQLVSTAKITDEIEINTKGAAISLADHEMRLLRRFGRLQDGICVDVAVLSDGLSGARVLRADVKDVKGEIRISAVGKLDSDEAISSEVHRYEKEVVRLPAGTYAPLLPPPLARVLGQKAAFYRLLEGFDYSLFDVLRKADVGASVCVKALRENEATWAKKPDVRRGTVGDFAKELIWEDRLPTIHGFLDGIDWKSYENREITVNICTRHGDLHGENARANGTLHVMLLDYGSVGPLPSAIDAVTLELSPFFHPHGSRDMLRWAPADGAIDWFDRATFSGLCTVPKFVNATRDWAHADGFSDREVLACAYIYILRQLQFPNTEKDLARAMIAGIVARGLKI